MQFVFLPRIQQKLVRFEATWNNHKIKGENKSPIQLFNKGAILNGVRGGFPEDHLQVVDENYAVDLDIATLDRAADAVILVDVHTMFPAELGALKQNFDPLWNDGCEGMQVFESCKEFLGLQ